LIWKIKIDDEAKKDLRDLDHQIKRKILSYLRKRITKNPKDFGRPLSGDKAGLWRYRVQDYRIICRIEDDKLIVLVVGVGHRKDVYDD